MSEQKLYYTIGEVAKMFNIKPSTIRYWEKQFPKYLKPKKSKNGNRLFTQKDIDNLKLIYHLIKEKKLTIEGAGKILKNYLPQSERNLKVINKLKEIKQTLERVKKQL